MASGTDSSFGWDLESTWGTRVAPSHFPRASKYEIVAEDVWVQGQGIQSGQQFEYAGHLARTDTHPKFSVEFDYQTRDVVGLFNNFFGGSISAVQQASTTACLHTFNSLGSWTNKASTIQIGVPRQGSTTVDCIELAGAKVTDLEVSAGVGELLKIGLSGGGKTYDTSQTLASPSYNASSVAPFTQTTLKQGSYGSETTLTGARAFNVRISRQANIEDNSTFGGTKTEPEPNGFPTIEGTFEVNYVSNALTTAWRAGTATSLVLEWVGANIESTYDQTFRLTLSACTIQGPGPNPDGPGLVTVPWTFKGGYDGTNPAVKLEIINTETSTTGY